MPIDAGVLYGIVALTSAVSQAYGHYLQQRNGTFANQQELLRDLRRAEADREHHRTVLTRREQADYDSRLRVAEAEYAFTRNQRMAEVQARLQLSGQIELARHRRALENSPFREEPEAVRARAATLCGDGARPLLLVAPFRHEDHGARTGPDAPALGAARRHRWLTSPWRADAAVAEGLVVRPLIYPDVDVQTIQETLSDLPVILLHGDVQARSRVLPELTAWGLPGLQGGRVHFLLPPMTLPRPVSPGGGDEDRLVFEDHLAAVCAWTAGGLAEWFHCLRTGRPPSRHLLLPSEAVAERRLVAADGARLLDMAIVEGALAPLIGTVLQAAVLAEGGLPAEAGQTIRAVLPDLRRTVVSAPVDLGYRLSEALARCDDAFRHASAGVAPDLAAAVARLRVDALPYRLGLLGGG